MENIGGALGFRATLNIDDFNVSAQSMERQIRNFSNTAISEVGEVEDSFRKMAESAGRYISYYLVGQGMHGLVNSIIQTRGQFQQLEIAFETMLGSTDKATTLMQQMVDTAAKTPFDLMGVAEGAKQLMAYGVSADKVNDTLVRLGNIASGLSIPLNDIVYLYGTTMVQGRLYAQDVRQFTGRGIPLVKELAEKYHKTTDEINAMVSAGKVGFKDVEEVINKMTNSGGQFYNLMEKQSASLTGQIANLEDAWDTVLNDWGKSNEGLFSGAIASATYLVEHMDTLVRILKSVAIGYGSVKAAIVLNSVATKGYTGIAVIDNTVRAAKLALMKAEATLSGTAKTQKEAMAAAENAYVTALEASLSAEQQAAIVKQLRIGAITSLLTVQQQEYLSNIGLTTSSAGYEEAALSVLTAEQRLALSKTDLTTKGNAYRTTIIQNTQAELQNVSAKIAQLETEKKAALEAVEAQKIKLVAARENINTISMEMSVAGQNCDMTRVAALQTKMAAATDQEAAIKKNLLAAQGIAASKSKELEAASSRKAALASQIDTAAKAAQTASTNLLSIATGKLRKWFSALFMTLKANPLGWIITLAGAAYSIFTMLSSKTEESKDTMSEFGEETKKVVSKLILYFSVLQNTDKETKTHKDALEKINALCREYNKTLLDENATLDIQKLKYQELTKAIQETTAQKILAKKTEAAGEELSENNDKHYKQWSNWTKTAVYTDSRGKFHKAENIRNMSEEVKEMTRSTVEEAAQQLAKMRHSKAKEEFSSKLNGILAAIKESANITDDEMHMLQWNIAKYLDSIIREYRLMDKAIADTKNELDDFNNALSQPPATDSTDYASMSFEDLDKLIVQTQKEIDTINAKTVKVDTDNTKLNELLAKLVLAKNALQTKQTSLNTEEGISNRIKQLKDNRASTPKFESDGKTLTKEWLKAGKEIDDLQKKLNQGNSKAENEAKKATRNAETLNQKQLEAERRLEEARIAVMEEGYDKRKAALDLQHKEALDRIEKEERELEKAHKEAGKGSLSQEEKEGFNQRKEYENQSYQKSANKLFDGEIDYKKKQYELYWRWVENMGKEVADEHFASLLKSGASYKQYLDKQIDELEAKKAKTEGEKQFLVSLKVERDDFTGTKSALDSFRDSINILINRSQTLAGKLEAVAEAKRKLENGETKLNADDKAKAYAEFYKQQAEFQKEVEETVLKGYKSFEEQRTDIAENYRLLREEAERIGDAERIKRIQQAEQEALSALNASFLMQSESWKNLFSDLDSLTVSEIEKLVSEIQKKLNTADLKLNPADLKAVLDRLDEAKAKILDVNPFEAFGKALLAVFTTMDGESKKSSKQIDSDWNNLASSLKGCFDFVNDAIDSCSVLSDLIGDTGAQTIHMLQGITMAGVAMADAIRKAERASIILTAISIALQAVTFVASLFNNDAKYEKRIQNLQKQIDALERSYTRLERAFNNTYWVFNDAERAGFEQNIKLINDQIAALEQQRQTALRTWDFARYAQLTAQIKDLNKQLSKAKEGDDMLGLYERQKRALVEQQELMRQQIEEEKKKKKSDDSKIQQWSDAIAQIDQQLEDMDRQMLETFAGTSTKEAIDQYADAIVEAYCAGEDAAKALGDTTREVLKKAVIDALKRQFLAKAMDDAVKFLAEAMSDGFLSKAEKARFEELTKKAGETFTNALDAVGDWIKDVEEDTVSDPLTGAVTSMSEETGGVIAGRLNAFIINQSEQTSVMREQLLQQSAIAQNTATANAILSQIDATLKRIETKDSSLLSQGIS